MERIEDINNVGPLVLMDHHYRYHWAESCAYGTVLDVACGIGYASQIFLKCPRVTDYIGVDIDEKAILKAKKAYASENCLFYDATIYHMPFLETASVDVVISMETLEHLEKPEDAVKEIRRVLKPDGIFIGSVPTWEYDEHHNEYHGKNEFHISRFHQDTLKSLLSAHFTYSNIYLSRIRLCMETHLIEKGFKSFSANKLQFENNDNGNRLGIYLFIASNRDILSSDMGKMQSAEMALSLQLTHDDLYAKHISLYNDYIKIAKLYNDLKIINDDIYKKYKQLYDDYIKIAKLYDELQNNLMVICQKKIKKFSTKLFKFSTNRN